MTTAERLHAIEEHFTTIEALLKQLRVRIGAVAEEVRLTAPLPRRIGKKR